MTAIRHVRAFTRQIPVYPKEAVDQRIEAMHRLEALEKWRSS